MPGAGAGVQAPEASPGRYVRRHDEVTPDDDGCDDVFRVAVRGPGDDPFDIPAKRAPVERLRRWRVSTTLSLLLPDLLACAFSARSTTTGVAGCFACLLGFGLRLAAQCVV
jgi:hypothetical protein